MCKNRSSKTKEKKMTETLKAKIQKRKIRLKKSIHEKQANKLKAKRMKRVKRMNRVYRIQENAKRQSKAKEKTTAMDRISRFKKAVRYGPIFPCCSCEQMMFENGVMQISKDILISVKSACDKTDTDLFCKVFGEKLKESSFGVALDGKINNHLICYTCRKHLLREGFKKKIVEFSTKRGGFGSADFPLRKT